MNLVNVKLSIKVPTTKETRYFNMPLSSGKIKSKATVLNFKEKCPQIKFKIS